VPIIFDDYVDPAFGTGALKVTPAHDINDYNLGLKHSLPSSIPSTPTGPSAQRRKYLSVWNVLQPAKRSSRQLKAEGAAAKGRGHPTRLGFSQRTNAVVEPRISTQWFVKMAALAEPALTAVTEGYIRIHPGG
jgi:valyl-tRNA synthetase